jgi:hypothetical protein
MSIITDVAILVITYMLINLLLKLRTFIYSKRNLTVGPYEDTVFCISFFIGLLSIGIVANSRYFLLVSIPFFVYLLVPVIFFSMKQWKEFLDLLNAYLNRGKLKNGRDKDDEEMGDS